MALKEKLKEAITPLYTEIGLIIFCAYALNINAQNERRLTFAAEYGYNYTYEDFGTISAVGALPLKDYFNAELGIKANTANLYSVAGNVKTIFPRKYGEWRLENRFLYRAVVRNHINELSGGLLFGFRCNHFNAGLGLFTRLVSKMGMPTITNQQRYIIEPFNLLYYFEYNVKKNNNLWNVGAKISNYDNFQMERFHQPSFALTGKFSLKNKPVSFFTEMALKPSGVFYIATNFYEFSSKIGVNYLF
jgi:hypothetical protein